MAIKTHLAVSGTEPIRPENGPIREWNATFAP